jgi:hypothetical protein
VFGVFLALGLRWLFRTWPHLQMDQLLFTVNAPVQGTNPEIFHSALTNIIPGTALALLAYAGIAVALRAPQSFWSVEQRKARLSKPPGRDSATALSLAKNDKFGRLSSAAPVETTPTPNRHAARQPQHLRLAVVAGLTGVLLIGGSAAVAWARLDIGSFLAARGSDSDFIRENYTNPRQVPLTFPETKRNLIYIFLESTETTWASQASGGAIETSVIPQLEQLALEHQSFGGNSGRVNGGFVLPGTSWTMGGMFAQTSGLPLITSIPGNAMSTQNSFFPGIETLGGILQSNGYTNALLVGSLVGFGGRGLYFTQHGDYEIWDYAYAVDNGLIPPDHFVWWGLEDERLFDIARDKTLELAAGTTPFNLTMLTVDTHAPEGWRSDNCPVVTGDQLSDVFMCSATLVSEYLNWLAAQPFWENTTVILSGDHLTMSLGFGGALPQGYDRRTYTAVINGAAEPADPELWREYSTLDLFPTTLAALGVDIPGGRLALGTDLYGTTPTLLEQFGRDYVATEFSKRSSFMDQLAGPLQVPLVAHPGTVFPLGSQVLFSPSQQYWLEIGNQGNVAIVFTWGDNEGLAWAFTTDTDAAGNWVQFSADGNLEVLDATNKVIRSSETAGRGATLELHDDGNLMIRDSAGNPIWAFWDVPGSADFAEPR